MFLIKVRTPFFQHHLLAADARECLKSLWALAGQDFDVVVVDASEREVSLLQLEALANAAARMEAGAGAAQVRRLHPM